jgi:glycosyltransferase involved in cell wall biosynthesis
MKVAVVTPTIGSEHLFECTKSVRNQTYKNLTHYVFIDGKDYKEEVKYHTEGSGVKYIELEENVGKGWYGHRVYAACSFLVNADVICYLDEDNWFEPCHVEKMVKKLEEGNQWVYSLRKIHDKDGTFLCEDNCESLGKWPVFTDSNMHHIDTSCYGIRRDIAVHIGHAWYGQWGADRKFFSAISKHFPKYDCTNAHTVGYRLDGNPSSVTKEFFEEGNRINRKKYNDEFPWKNNGVMVAPGIKIIL